MTKISKQPYARIRVKQSFKFRQVVVACAIALSVLAGSAIFFINMFNNVPSHGAVAGDYRSKSDGNWSSASTWERYDGTNWIAAINPPTASNGGITIRSGDTVSVVSNVSIDQTVIQAGACLSISTATLTVANGTGVDLTVAGELITGSGLTLGSGAATTISGIERLLATGVVSHGSSASQTIAAGGRIIRRGGTFPAGGLVVQSGGCFEHAMDAGAIPTATWQQGALLEITGCITTPPTGMSQTFRNLSWNCLSQNTVINLAAALISIQENLEIKSTGTSSLMLDQQGNNSNLTVGGNMQVLGGTTYGCINGSTSITVNGNYTQSAGILAFNLAGGTAYGNQSTIMRVNGYAAITGGTLDLSQCDANNAAKGNGALYVKGDLMLSGSASLTVTSAMSHGLVNFNGTVEQRFISSDNVTGLVDFEVSPLAILRMDNQVMKSGGYFMLNSTGGLISGHADGITATAPTGNIQVSGLRTYSSNADYTYNGSITQATGNGLPSSVRNLTFNNDNNISLTNSVSASGVLSFLAGKVITGSNVLTLGTGISVNGTLNHINGHVVGSFRRWIPASLASNILFPVGTLANYNGINYSFTTAPSAGTVTAVFMQEPAGLNGLPLFESGNSISTVSDFYWAMTAENGFSNGQYNVNVYANGITGVSDYTKLRLIRRVDSASPWTFNGIHAAAGGTNSNPVVNRNAMNLLGHYGIGSTNINSLPVELLYFQAKPTNGVVELSWATAAEKDNDFFTVERSGDGRVFNPILTKAGAGNSRVTLKYSAIDESPTGSLIYYRLKQTDYNGKSSYSEIEVVRLAASGKKAIEINTAAPNPFSDHFNLQFNITGNTEVQVRILSFNGQLLHQEQIMATEGLNAYDYYDQLNLPAGTYIIALDSPIGRTTQKIIKR